jgi:hypothetical protein
MQNLLSMENKNLVQRTHGITMCCINRTYDPDCTEEFIDAVLDMLSGMDDGSYKVD